MNARVCYNGTGGMRMKLDRLYALTLYLLNHGKTPAPVLARRFEVSVRTIQRDMDALCRAGIPVVAVAGANGGYALAEAFCMSRQLTGEGDCVNILTALRGLASAAEDPRVDATLEKIAALLPEGRSDVVLDLSVLRERDRDHLNRLRKAIRRGKCVRFDYTNARGERRSHAVEPTAVVYRWYAWYLLGYLPERADYRIYKLARMEALQEMDAQVSRSHPEPAEILAGMDARDQRTPMEVIARCTPTARSRALEYLNGEVIAEEADGCVQVRFHAMEDEHFWLGTLLALGGEVEILSPESARSRVLAAAKKLVALYDQP